MDFWTESGPPNRSVLVHKAFRQFPELEVLVLEVGIGMSAARWKIVVGLEVGIDGAIALCPSLRTVIVDLGGLDNPCDSSAIEACYSAFPILIERGIFGVWTNRYALVFVCFRSN